MKRIGLFAAWVIVGAASFRGAAAQEVYATRQDQQPSTQFDHASTFEEGAMRGAGEFVRSAGDFNYATSLALINREIARDKYIDNRIKGVQAYFEMRRINEENRAYENGSKPTQQDMVKYAKERAPERLGSYQYEPALGKLYWPTVFLGRDFEPHRQALDTLMSEREPANSGAGSKNHHDIRRVVQAMEELLQTKVEAMSPTDYAAAKKFLASLEYEAQTPAVPVATVIE